MKKQTRALAQALPLFAAGLLALQAMNARADRPLVSESAGAVARVNSAGGLALAKALQAPRGHETSVDQRVAF